VTYRTQDPAALQARIAELEAENATLRAQLEARSWWARVRAWFARQGEAIRDAKPKKPGKPVWSLVQREVLSHNGYRSDMYRATYTCSIDGVETERRVAISETAVYWHDAATGMPSSDAASRWLCEQWKAAELLAKQKQLADEAKSRTARALS
jgi:hypothetical protein